MARPSSFAPKKDFYSLRHTSIVTSRHSFMIAVTVRVNNHCPAFLKLAIYSAVSSTCSNVKRMF